MATTDPVERFREWYAWFQHNRRSLAPDNLKKRLEFHEKMLDGLMELMAITIDADRVAKNFGSSNLYMPSHLIIEDEHGKPVKVPLK